MEYKDNPMNIGLFRLKILYMQTTILGKSEDDLHRNIFKLNKIYGPKKYSSIIPSKQPKERVQLDQNLF